MAWLKCPNCRAEEAMEDEAQDWEETPDEYLKVSTGHLLASYRCDICNVWLEPGGVAYLVQSFPIHAIDMDTGQELEYFSNPDTIIFAATHILPLIPKRGGVHWPPEQESLSASKAPRNEFPEQLRKLPGVEAEYAQALRMRVLATVVSFVALILILCYLIYRH